jgi:hypothetical protein
MSLPVRLRIVVLRADIDVWCEVCAVPCAVTIIYAIEGRDGLPAWVHQLTYCEVCDTHGST